MPQTPRIVTGAIVAGVISFVILYASLALGLVCALSLLPDSIDPAWLQRGFKLLGVLAMLFPGYAAARVAGRNGLLTGLCAAAVSALFLVYTFSWEGTRRGVVWFAIARTAGLAVAAGCVGGLLADWRNRSNRS